MKKIPAWKFTLFVLIPCIGLIVLAEAGSSIVYYQIRGNQPLAVVGIFNAAPA